jgi:hypothetical protein
MALSQDHLELLNRYPDQAKELGGKVLGGSYFPGQRGFAFESATSATAIRGDTVSDGPLIDSDLVPSALFVLSAPNQELAVRIARLHPAARDGGVEVRALFQPPAE